MKALPINVYRTATLGDCTNGGITSRYSRLLLVHERGFIEVDENNPPETLVKIVTRNLFGKEYKHIEPVAPCPSDRIGYMSGGNLAYTSDSRFRELSQYPLTVHDRTETQEQYDMMFD